MGETCRLVGLLHRFEGMNQLVIYRITQAQIHGDDPQRSFPGRASLAQGRQEFVRHWLRSGMPRYDAIRASEKKAPGLLRGALFECKLFSGVGTRQRNAHEAGEAELHGTPPFEWPSLYLIASAVAH